MRFNMFGANTDTDKAHRRNRRRFALLGILMFFVVIIIGCGVYISDYYHADEAALSVLTDSVSSVEITNIRNHKICFVPGKAKAGLIFYPGGKVQYEAYAPLMEKLAENGILCVLVHMPGNLAVLDMNAADGIIQDYPEISKWYIGGHSLGGAMAASYVSKHSDEYNGLILLAAYSTADLTDSGLNILSIYGSSDGVLDRDSYKTKYKNLPSTTTEVIIQGGCHSYFGDYGMQKGDGTPEITREEQLSQTTTEIVKVILGR